jgi:hypothetical protein
VKRSPLLSPDPSAELAAIADDLRALCDALPVQIAARVRVHAEALAVEAVRVGDEEREKGQGR